MNEVLQLARNKGFPFNTLAINGSAGPGGANFYISGTTIHGSSLTALHIWWGDFGGVWAGSGAIVCTFSN